MCSPVLAASTSSGGHWSGAWRPARASQLLAPADTCRPARQCANSFAREDAVSAPLAAPEIGLFAHANRCLTSADDHDGSPLRPPLSALIRVRHRSTRVADATRVSRTKPQVSVSQRSAAAPGAASAHVVRRRTCRSVRRRHRPTGRLLGAVQCTEASAGELPSRPHQAAHQPRPWRRLAKAANCKGDAN